MSLAELTDRERKVLEAVIRTYVATAQPAGSRQLARRFGLGVSPATIRNTMSDLEEKGYLFHPHTSAGRIPTDTAYRVYVDTLLPATALSEEQRDILAQQIAVGGSVETILRRAAQSLGVIAQELGLALGPRFDDTRLERVELVRLASDRLLMVLSLQGNAVRTIFVDANTEVADRSVADVTRVLNDRLAGLTLSEIRATLAQRLRDLIEEYTGARVPTGALDITFYRDDVTLRAEQRAHPQPVVKATRLDFPLEGKSVVVVDDVLYTGRTIRSAIEAIFDYGRPERVQLAVLVDRGHRELPIRPDYVGKNLPTARSERVNVELVEIDELDRVVLIHP